MATTSAESQQDVHSKTYVVSKLFHIIGTTDSALLVATKSLPKEPVSCTALVGSHSQVAIAEKETMPVRDAKRIARTRTKGISQNVWSPLFPLKIHLVRKAENAIPLDDEEATKVNVLGNAIIAEDAKAAVSSTSQASKTAIQAFKQSTLEATMATITTSLLNDEDEEPLFIGPKLDMALEALEPLALVHET